MMGVCTSSTTVPYGTRNVYVTAVLEFCTVSRYTRVLYSLGLYPSRLRVATAGHMGKGSPSASNGEKSFLGVSTIVSSSGKRGTCYGDLFRSLHAPSQS